MNPKQPMLPLIAPVDIQPTPTQISVSETQTTPRMIVLQISTSAGVQFVFLPPEIAREVSRNIERVAGVIDVASPALAQTLADQINKRFKG